MYQLVAVSRGGLADEGHEMCGTITFPELAGNPAGNQEVEAGGVWGCHVFLLSIVTEAAAQESMVETSPSSVWQVQS